ncbi:Beige/BEACH domain containing protein [Nitzschia inconspicua]|uniref:Beige/BEACH domain containing protein n=1 Tax=Nitzschia inconspicua TaxID=303405 RepID=A0A9K3LD10_9STRA|nr:Beige/BEACH domain containing protein [Nitzschia inconspicua]
MTVSWFGSDVGLAESDGHHGSHRHHPHHTNKLSMKDAVKALYPPKAARYFEMRGSSVNGTDRTRFSTLLLEHGEKHLQDWAVIAYTQPVINPTSSSPGLTSPRSKKTTQTTWAAQIASPTKSSRKLSSSLSAQASLLRQQKMALDKETYPSVHMTKIEGRLHLCSQSVVFEPNDVARPILRCPFNKMDAPPKEYPNKTDDPALLKSYEAMTVEFESSKHVIMKANNAISPFEAVPIHTLFRFTFLHSSPTSLVELCQRLFTIWHNYKMSKATGRHHHHPHYIPELEELLKPMMNRPFDPSNLLDVRERPLTSNIRCNLLTPLQSQPGCMVLTQERVYFQPALGVISLETTPQATSYMYPRDLIATARRYSGLKDSALELYWKDGTSSLFGFERKHEREQVLRLMPKVRSNGDVIPCHTDREFIVQASQEWQRGSISNYDYLLLLNSAAGRTVQDLSRYPVFPWVIADYSSAKLDLTKKETFRDLTKPIGALNEKRLEYFQQRLVSMEGMEDPFLYGTHYSAAGYVLYYLVRSMPEHMLCLQNGKFDAPDRLFHSISQCYSCVLTNHADVKELTPEFFNPNNDFDFLINARGLQLGATQNGDRVNDVTLPPWAKSPRDFLKKNSKALESQVCTSMLPRWIDLVFGSKSRGEAAKDANNLFHYSAYLGPADLSAMSTPQERFQAELQATEFGIVPDQLFVGPHPLRHETVDESFINPDVGRTFSGTDDGKADTWELLETEDLPPQGDDGGSREDPMTESHDDVNSSGGNPSGKPINLPPGMQSNPFHAADTVNPFGGDKSSNKDRISIPMSGSGDIVGTNAGLSSFSNLEKEPSLSNVSSSGDQRGKYHSPHPTQDPTSPTRPMPATSAEWDIKFLERSRLHDDAVSGTSFFPVDNDQCMLVTTSLDGGLKVHTVDLGLDGAGKKQQEGGITGTLSRFSYIAMSRGQVSPVNQSKLTEYRSHTARDPLACLSTASDSQGGKVAFAGGHDDVVLAYGINSGAAVASLYSHRDAVTGLDMLPRPPATTQSALWSKKSTHIMVSGSWDATIKVWSVVVASGETVSIDREPLAELFDADSSIVCVSAAAIPDGQGGIVVAAGSADGSFCVWNLHSDGDQVVIHKEAAKRGSGPCSVIQWSAEKGQLSLFTGFATGKVASYVLVDGSIRKASAASVGVAVQSLVHSYGILLIGCSDGGLRLIPIRDGAYFTSDLSLWPNVNNTNSPGLTSVSLSFMGMSNNGSGKCICCTGAEDGSIAIFELKRASRSG